MWTIPLIIACVLLAGLNLDIALSWLRLARLQAGKTDSLPMQASSVSANLVHVSTLHFQSLQYISAELVADTDSALQSECMDIATRLRTMQQGPQDLTLCIDKLGRNSLVASIRRDVWSETFLTALTESSVMVVIDSLLYRAKLAWKADAEFEVLLHPINMQTITYTSLLGYDTKVRSGVQIATVMWWPADTLDA